MLLNSIATRKDDDSERTVRIVQLRPIALLMMGAVACILLVDPLWAEPSKPSLIKEAPTCDASDVQSAIDSASQGDIVKIPPGSCTWTVSVHIVPTKGITLQGAGEDRTVITDGGTLSGFMNNCTIHKRCGWAALLYVGFTASNASLTRVTGITFVSPSSGNARYEMTVQGNGLDKFRIDHVTCTGSLVNRCIGTFSDDDGTSEFSGLVDHVTCNTNSKSSPQCFNNNVAFGRLASQAWKWPVLLGSNHATYWEDITCTYHNSVADSCFDNYEGHSFVLRFSTFTHIGIGNHGVDSAHRGAHLVEVYRNTFTTPVPISNGMNWRSGPNILFDNSFSGPYSGTGINISTYRTSSNNSTRGIAATNCAGDDPWDGNLGTSSHGNLGYPCLDQVGWSFPPPPDCTGASCAKPNGHNAVYLPAYIWGNTSGKSPTTASVGGYPSSYVHINGATPPNRIDIYTDVGASCSGESCTTGIGQGPREHLPPNCTVGVGYWATNEGDWNKAPGTPGGQGVLYKCTSTNTWEKHYEPYRYPHPLQLQSLNKSGDSAPRAVTLTIK